MVLVGDRMKVIVVGSGPSGMIAAIRLALNNEVVLVDSNNSLGKKLLLSGNGKCNYWNRNIVPSKYITDDGFILSSILTRDNIDNTFKFLDSLGLYPTIKGDLYYPYSENSHSVLSILKRKLESSNVEIKYNFKVIDIKKDNGVFTIVSSDNETITSDAVIIASGGSSMKKTGSDGSIMNILKSMGHEVIPFIPSLNRIILGCNFKSIENIRSRASIKVLVNNEELFEDSGEVLFKSDGISGIVSFNASAYVSYYLNKGDIVDIAINYLNSIDNVDEFLKNRSEQLNNPSIESLLESLIDYRLMFYLLDYISLNKDKLYNSLTEEEKNNLISVLTNNKYRALEVGDLDSSQVSIGGLKLTNINPNNFESNIVSNLYIIGEALDVAGICGGYNIAFAFISGFIVGCHLC